MADKLQVEEEEHDLFTRQKTWKDRIAFLKDPRFWKVLILGQGKSNKLLFTSKN